MRSGFASLNVSSFNTYISLPDYISSTIFSSISLLFILLASKEQFITVGSFWRRQDKEWQSRGANFITEPKDHGIEIRCYIRDPDGYIIEVSRPSSNLLQCLSSFPLLFFFHFHLCQATAATATPVI